MRSFAAHSSKVPFAVRAPSLSELVFANSRLCDFLIRPIKWVWMSLGAMVFPFALFANDFYQHAFVALTVEFAVEDLLPGAKIQPPVGRRDHYLAPHHLAF